MWDLCDNMGVVLTNLPSGAISLHRSATMTQPSCLLLQVNQNFFKFKKGNIGIANIHKKYGDKIRIANSWVIYWLGDGVTVLPLGRHTNTSPILSQRYTQA